MFRAVAVAILATCLGGCELPRDPAGTLQNVRGGTLRVGVVDNPPWVKFRDGQVTGVEVELVKSMAEELGARVHWVPGSTEDLLEALGDRELDLVAGGLTRSTPWEDRVALTRTYFETHRVVAVSADQTPVEDLRGREVAVRAGDALTAALVRRHGGTPREADEPASAGLPVAAEDWRAHSWGLKRGDLVLGTSEHVLAAPQGENGWLVFLDRFLHGRLGEVPSLLEAELHR
jgi:polar amino acid transport system substrate-binding protein